MNNIKSILTSLGYRRFKNEIWGKPFGYAIFKFDTEKLEISSWTAQEKGASCWDATTIKGEDIMDEIVAFESYGYPRYASHRAVRLDEVIHFEFLTPEDRAAIIVGI